jgi:transposase
MKKILSGRPVDLSGINIKEVFDFVNSDNSAKGIIKCQAIISLHNGNSMQNVCAVLGVTRETVRKWKERLRQGGATALLNEKKAGKRTRIGVEKQRKLKILIKQKPLKHGYDSKKWTGLILQEYLLKNWNIKIGTRAAQLWLKQLR